MYLVNKYVKVIAWYLTRVKYQAITLTYLVNKYVKVIAWYLTRVKENF